MVTGETSAVAKVLVARLGVDAVILAARPKAESVGLILRAQGSWREDLDAYMRDHGGGSLK